jgi:hypothetical protein
VIWFIIRRLLGLVVTLWAVFTISFLLMHAVPGGPYSNERNLPPEIEENIKEKYRLNLSPWEQYTELLRDMLHGDMGLSQRLLDFTVNDVIKQGLPVSACLGILALTFAITLGLTAGITSALYRGSAADVALMSLATVGIALPSFVIGGLSILLFVFTIPIFPAAGWGTIRQLVLPAICLGMQLKLLALHVRACSMRCRRISSVRRGRKDSANSLSRCGMHCRRRCSRSCRFLVPPWLEFSPAPWSSNVFSPSQDWAGILCNRRCNVITRSRWASCFCIHFSSIR